MPTSFAIVEGDGDVLAVPLLLRRISSELLGCNDLVCLTPYRLPRTRLLNVAELSRALAIAHAKLRNANPPCFVILLMDADDDCPRELVARLTESHAAQIARAPTSIVFAVREFESWFLSANMSAMHHSSLRADAEIVDDPESVGDAKGRFRDTVISRGRSYSETVDQPKYVSCMDLITAQKRSPSFDKLVRELRRHLAPR